MSATLIDTKTHEDWKIGRKVRKLRGVQRTGTIVTWDAIPNWEMTRPSFPETGELIPVAWDKNEFYLQKENHPIDVTEVEICNSVRAYSTEDLKRLTTRIAAAFNTNRDMIRYDETLSEEVKYDYNWISKRYEYRKNWSCFEYAHTKAHEDFCMFVMTGIDPPLETEAEKAVIRQQLKEKYQPKD